MPQSKRLFINEYELHVFAMQRSGHHAVCRWLGGHFPSKYAFINDISRLKDFKRQAAFYGFNNLEKERELNGKLAYKDALIINVEERAFKDGGRKFFKQTKYYPRGRSRKTFNIIVLRDPLNFFASRIKFSERRKSQARVWLTTEAIEMWKDYTREFLGETNYLKEPKIMINYVDWFTDIDYRRSISAQLDLKHSERYLQHVPNYGKGSSFSLRAMNNRAQDMKVLDRWKNYQDHAFIKRLLKDEEVMKLSKEIFGDKVEYNEL
jgi:hypothetical protein